MIENTRLNTEKFNYLKGLGTGIFFLSLTGIVTGLIPNPFYVRMVPVTALDYLFLITTSILAGLYFGKESCSTTGGRFAGAGGFMGFLAFSCPVCNAILLAFFSSSAIMTYFDPLRPYLGVVSTLMLGFFVYRDFVK
ncbi:MAG: hypothetical protein ABEK04_05310 [Candidatus Nanohalobium sp.]